MNLSPELRQRVRDQIAATPDQPPAGDYDFGITIMVLGQQEDEVLSNCLDRLGYKADTSEDEDDDSGIEGDESDSVDESETPVDEKSPSPLP